MDRPGSDTAFAGSIPELYDSHLVPPIFEPYAADLASRVEALDPSRALETAAGTGVATRAMARALPAHVDLVATDLNQPMPDRAAAVGTQRPVRRQQADATRLPFDDASFDIVVCQFSVMFFPDKGRALHGAHTARLFRPGSDFARPRERGFSAAPRFETFAARSRAASARVPAIAYCQGTPLRNESLSCGREQKAQGAEHIGDNMIKDLVSATSRLARTTATALLALTIASPVYAWEPSKPVEFVIPAGTGGGADQMARLIQGVVAKHALMKEPLIVVNKSGGAGAEGFMAIKEAKGDPHKIIITLSNLFTTPLATGVPFNWKDMTPVAMLALDQFVLWTNADEPYKSASEYIAAVKAAGPNKFKMGGTGSKQEDQIITVAIEKATGTKFIYVPFKGGGEVAVQLVGGHVNSTVNNPIEAVAQWRAGKLRAQCVFDHERMPFKAKVTDTQSWNDIPTCKEAGLPIDYTMLRGIFMPPGVTPDQLAFYVDLLNKVRGTPEWKDFIEKGAFNATYMTGAPFTKWLEEAETTHKALMTEAGFLAK